MCDHCGCRQFGPIADLTAEHELILELAWIVSEDPDRDGERRLRTRDRLVALMDIHVEKEERGLYPELITTGDLDAAHSAVLEEEHRIIRMALVSASFDRRDYFALAAHIEEEEMELFSGAMFAFDDVEWDHLTSVHTHADGGHDHDHPHDHPHEHITSPPR